MYQGTLKINETIHKGRSKDVYHVPHAPRIAYRKYYLEGGRGRTGASVAIAIAIAKSSTWSLSCRIGYAAKATFFEGSSGNQRTRPIPGPRRTHQTHKTPFCLYMKKQDTKCFAEGFHERHDPSHAWLAVHASPRHHLWKRDRANRDPYYREPLDIERVALDTAHWGAGGGAHRHEYSEESSEGEVVKGRGHGEGIPRNTREMHCTCTRATIAAKGRGGEVRTSICCRPSTTIVKCSTPPSTFLTLQTPLHSSSGNDEPSPSFVHPST